MPQGDQTSQGSCDFMCWPLRVLLHNVLLQERDA